MTAIIGYADGKNVWMVGDESGSSNSVNEFVGYSKVFIHNENMLIGYTTSYRMGQILQYNVEFPKVTPDIDLYKYMCTSFVDVVLKAFEHNKYLKIVNNEVLGGNFLVGLFGRLFSIQEDFSVIEYKTPHAAIGSGYPYSLAAMEALEQAKTSGFCSYADYNDYVKWTLKTALKVTCMYSPNVGVCNTKNIPVFKV